MELTSMTATNPHLQFSSASTNAPMAEYFPIPDWYLEGCEKGSTTVDAIDAVVPQDDELPSRPGLGAARNTEAVAHLEVSST